MAFSCPLHSWYSQESPCPLCITTVITVASPFLTYDYIPNERELTDAQLIEKLKNECKRIKMQRNLYEENLRRAHKEINRLSVELKLLENHINKK